MVARYYIWIFLSISFGALGACDGIKDEIYLQSQKKIQEISEKLNYRANRLENTVQVQMSKVDSILEHSQEHLRELPRRWKSAQGKILFEFKGIQRELKLIKSETDSYFKRLDIVNSHIEDSTLRLLENQQNQLHKQKWSALVSDLESTVNEIDSILELGQDYYQVLVGSGLRQSKRTAVQTHQALWDNFRIGIADLHRDVDLMLDLIATTHQNPEEISQEDINTTNPTK